MLGLAFQPPSIVEHRWTGKHCFTSAPQSIVRHRWTRSSLRDYGVPESAPRGYRGLKRWGRGSSETLPKGGSQMLRPVVAPGATWNRITPTRLIKYSQGLGYHCLSQMVPAMQGHIRATDKRLASRTCTPAHS